MSLFTEAALTLTQNQRLFVMATTGLDRTFNLLARVPNGAADELLAYALAAPDPDVRRHAIQAGLQRETLPTTLKILQAWQHLDDADLRLIQAHPAAMRQAVTHALDQPHDNPIWRNALEALQMLSLDELLPTVIDRLEMTSDPKLREYILATILHLSGELGVAARDGRGRASVREPVLERLAQSVRQLPTEQNNALCEAFLAASCWGDRQLRQLLEENSATAQKLTPSLMHSNVPGVLQLMAGFLRLRKIPGPIRRAIVSRRDAGFRNAMLKFVGSNSSGAVLRNLRELPPLPVFAASGELTSITPIHLHHGLLIAQTLNANKLVDRMQVLFNVLAAGDPQYDASVVQTLALYEPLNETLVMDAAIQIVDETLRGSATLTPTRHPSLFLAKNSNLPATDELPIHSKPADGETLGEYRQLLGQMVPLLNYPNPAISRGLTRLLAGLYAEHLMDRLNELPEPFWIPLGALVQRVDPQTSHTLTETLRSPSMHRRVLAIQAISACQSINEFESQLTDIALHDYREVRLMAIRALADGTQDDSLLALRQISECPDSFLRDIARNALQFRLQSPAQNKTSKAPTFPLTLTMPTFPQVGPRTGPLQDPSLYRSGEEAR